MTKEEIIQTEVISKCFSVGSNTIELISTAMDIFATQQTASLQRELDEAKGETKKAKKEVVAIKEYIVERKKEVLKINGENFGLLQFIQRLEESFTWVREI